MVADGAAVFFGIAHERISFAARVLELLAEPVKRVLALQKFDFLQMGFNRFDQRFLQGPVFLIALKGFAGACHGFLNDFQGALFGCADSFGE